MDIDGGSARTVCDAKSALLTRSNWGAWSSASVILFFFIFEGSGIQRVSAEGGSPAPATQPDPSRHDTGHRWPTFLPDGKHFLYLSLDDGPDASHALWAGELDSKETRLVGHVPSRVAYAEPGYLLYAQEGALMAAPFDAKTLRITGRPVPTGDRVNHFQPSGRASFSVSQTGVLAPGPELAESRLVWLDRTGREVGAVGKPAPYWSFRISPDGATLVVAISDRQLGTPDIWLADLDRERSRRLTSDPRYENHPVWSPDGKSIAFSSDRTGPPDLNIMDAEGLQPMRELLKVPAEQLPQDFSPDGRYLLYVTRERGREDLWLLPLFGDRKPAPYIATDFAESNARFSPDGKWVAYETNETGLNQVYVRPFPGPGPAVQVSAPRGMSPRWRRDGKELFYLGEQTRRVMAVAVTTGERFAAGEPRLLFEKGEELVGWDVAPDGQKFLVATSIPGRGEAPKPIVLNWTAALKK